MTNTANRQRVTTLAHVTCSRSSDETIRFRITDNASHGLVELTMTHEQFASVVTGLWTDGVQAEFVGANNIGCTREIKVVTAPFDDKGVSYSARKTVALTVAQEWTDTNYPGWIVDDSFSGQTSFGPDHINFRIVRYV